MSNGTFTDFMNALRNFESGVKYDSYQKGWLTEARIIEYVGADVWAQYQNGEITWTQMQYHAQNDLGFVGYQLGEALMIDLGYYTDDSIYMNGEETNLWDGHFTGKNGIHDFNDLRTGLQESVMVDAFGYNLTIMESMLAEAGTKLADFIGQTVTYDDGGTSVTVTLSFTGILAAAHLRGADSVVDLLLNGNTSQDEYGTSILQYVEQFGGFDPMDQATLVDAFKNGTSMSVAETLWNKDFNNDGKVGDQPVSGGDDGGTGETNTGSDGTGTEYDLTWDWGKQETIYFDAAHDTLDFSNTTVGDYHVWEWDGDVFIEMQNNGQHTYTLEDTTFAELDMSNLVGLDAAGRAFWDELI